MSRGGVGWPRCDDTLADGGRVRERFDHYDLVSKLDSRLLLVRRPDLAKLVQDCGKEVEQRFQDLCVLDHAHDQEMQLIHVFGKPRAEPTLAILYIQPDFWLRLNHL